MQSAGSRDKTLSLRWLALGCLQGFQFEEFVNIETYLTAVKAFPAVAHHEILQSHAYRLARRFSFICCRMGCSEPPMRSATQVASTSMMSRCMSRDTMGL
jgi:hypothetical protein